MKISLFISDELNFSNTLKHFIFYRWHKLNKMWKHWVCNNICLAKKLKPLVYIHGIGSYFLTGVFFDAVIKHFDLYGFGFTGNFFSPIISVHVHILCTVLYTFPEVWTRRIFEKSTFSLVGDHFLYSHDLNVWFKGETVRRNKMLVTLWRKRIKAFYQNTV